MNILFVIPRLTYGGAGKQLAMTANYLSRNGHKVSVYSFIWNTPQQELDEDVEYIPEMNIPSSRQMQWIIVPFRIRKIVKSHKIDLVISWLTNSGCYSVLATIGLKVKTIFSERSDPYMEPSNIKWIVTKIASFSDGGVFQTEKARDYYSNLANRSIVLPNPINPDIKMPEIVDYGSRPKEIIFLGRMFNLQKRVDLLLKSFKIIHESLPDYQLSLYGDGKDLANNIQIAKELGINDYVTFHGAINNVIERIHSARLMLVTSDYEGIPNTVIEAFMAGVPVAMTDCSPGGGHVLIEDNKNGIIVPFRDYESLAKRAIYLLQDEEKAKTFIYESRKKLEDFNPQQIFLKWLDYIEKIVL